MQTKTIDTSHKIPLGGTTVIITLTMTAKSTTHRIKDLVNKDKTCEKFYYKTRIFLILIHRYATSTGFSFIVSVINKSLFKFLFHNTVKCPLSVQCNVQSSNNITHSEEMIQKRTCPYWRSTSPVRLNELI